MARADAMSAARRAGIKVSMLREQRDIDDAADLLNSVWAPAGAGITSALLRSLEHGGNYVAGAFLRRQLCGVSVGFFAEPLGSSLHSHITGVVRASSGHGVGRALKLHQRAWALERGLRTVTWTFDPLIARNAFVNLHHLGAHVAEYLIDFYGQLDPATGVGSASDRLFVVWDIGKVRISAVGGLTAQDESAALLAGGARVLLDPAEDGRPRTSIAGADSQWNGDLLVGIPGDMEDLRSRDPRSGAAWRRAFRAAVAPRLENRQWSISRFTRSGWYVLTRTEK
jgi:predicted GNAT superfamily acetyltransferase